MNIYEFPNQKVVLARLMTAALMPEGDILGTLVRFSQMVGGQKRNARGVNMGFQLSAHEIAQRENSMPGLVGLLNVEFDDLMTAVIADNPEFLKEVIDVHAAVLAEMRGASS